MSSDEMPSQSKIDAPVSEVPQKPGPSPVTNEVAPASKPLGSSSPSAQPESDSLPARLARLESNYAIIKKEMQAVLLDLREKYLDSENPFNTPAAPSQSPAKTHKTEALSNEAWSTSENK
jgi:hypothetical protein